MKSQTVKNFIDNKIYKSIAENGMDKAKEEIFTICERFRKRLKEDGLEIDYKDLNLCEIESIRKVEHRYKLTYIFFAYKRMIDLYVAENKFAKMRLDESKIFKLIIFKEKMSGKYNLPEPDYNKLEVHRL